MKLSINPKLVAAVATFRTIGDIRYSGTSRWNRPARTTTFSKAWRLGGEVSQQQHCALLQNQ